MKAPAQAFAFRVCTLVASILFCSASIADDLEELSVTEADGTYNIRIVSILDAHSDNVHSVITDYINSDRISPTIFEVDILPTESDDVVRVRNLSRHSVGPINVNIDWVGDIVDTGHGQIYVTTIPELSDFKSGFATWEILPQGEKTRLLYESNLKPDFFIPPVIGGYIMKCYIEKNTLATIKRIEYQASMMSEEDVKNEPEQMKTLMQAAK